MGTRSLEASLCLSIVSGTHVPSSFILSQCRGPIARGLSEAGEEEGWISRILQILKNGGEEIRFILKYIFVTRHELKLFKIILGFLWAFVQGNNEINTSGHEN